MEELEKIIKRMRLGMSIITGNKAILAALERDIRDAYKLGREQISFPYVVGTDSAPSPVKGGDRHA